MTDSPTTILTSASTQTSSSPPKRKRRPAGTPDPDAEVVALSPKTLMESDRYVCEICNQGFQRDQNLQMHRRRHKVPWKLLKRADPDVRKRVYVCPEPSCLHHNPCHALGDLVGIKKHYRRKHSSMKQWECDKCSKAYAVQSDYKAHVKTCGTRGHCCDCGRVFSRVESFIEHQDTCTAASNKRGGASISDQQATSLPSLGAPSADHHYLQYATLTPTNPSSSAEKVPQKDNNHHKILMNLPLNSIDQDCSVSALPLLPYMQSACSAHVLGPLVTSADISLPLPISPPSCNVPTLLLAPVLQSPSAAMPTPADVPGCTKVSWETPQPSLPPDDPDLLHRHNKAELQLLPTKPHSSQLESSQSSNVSTWAGKDITSTTSATKCSSPCVDHRKQAVSLDLAPCKLQLSIGFIHKDHNSACNEESTSLPVSGIHHEGTFAAVQSDYRTTNIPWPTWSTFPASGHEKHHVHSGKLCTPTEKQGIIAGYGKDAMICLELATGATPAGARCNDTNSLEMRKKQDCDYFRCEGSGCQVVNIAHENPENTRIDMKGQRVDDDENLQLGSPKHCNMSSGASDAVVIPPADQQHSKEGQPNLLLSNKITEPDRRCDFLVDCVPPQQIAAELRLQRAQEKLKRACEEKLEAEKAWKEAKRENEQAEVELAEMKRLAKYYNREYDEEEVGTRKSTYNNISDSASTLTLSNPVASVSANSLQMQLNAGGVIISNAPTVIACPSCHHTQVLYHPANLSSTIFLASQELSTPPPHSN